MKRLIELFLVSLRLGLTSFGGPVAHLGYFHTEYVKRLNWMNEKEYMELVSLSQFLPGPASSQVGIGIGLKRAGILGGITSFLGFTLPSVILLMLFVTILKYTTHFEGLIHGLKLVAVAIVLHAIISMAKNFTNKLTTQLIAIMAVVVTLLFQTSLTHILVILIGAFLGLVFIKETDKDPVTNTSYVSKTTGAIALVTFFTLLFLSPVVRNFTDHKYVEMFDSFYRASALVFGGGHVVLPLLEAELVPSDMTEATFLAGYGATQAVPGPLFTFASYLGTVMAGVPGGLFATFAIFLPAFLLIVGVLPFWQMVVRNKRLREAVVGVNAAVVGILISAWIMPIVSTTIHTIFDVFIAVMLFIMLMIFKMPPWVIVVTGAIVGVGMGVFM